MVRMRTDARANRFVALQTRFVRIHFGTQLTVACPSCQTHLQRVSRVHLVTRYAGKLPTPKTRRRLHAVELATRDADHSVAPKTIREKIRLGFSYKILLFSVIWRTRLNHEALAEIFMARAKIRALPVKIDFVRHVIEGPDAVALSAIQVGDRSRKASRICYRRVRFGCQMNFESPKGISVDRDVIASLAMTCFAGDPEFRDARIPLVSRDEARLAFRNMAVHTRPVPSADRIIFLQIGRHEKSLAYRRPHFFGDDISEGKLLERAAFAGFDPRDLQIVRTSEKNNLLWRSVIATKGTHSDEEFITFAL
jgi:hypothetical protein